jgi:heme/copper-type cytochrome/quinol oxidase subunit 2
MRNAARAGVSGLILIVIMVGGSLLLWVGVPAAWLYIGSRVEGATSSLGAALAVTMVGVVVSIIAIVPGLSWLNNKHVELREARGLESHGHTALEAVMTISAIVAVIGFSVWFFVFAGPGPMLAPRN